MERFVVSLNERLTAADVDRIRLQFRRWSQQGGLLVLDQGITLQQFPPPLPQPIHEGVSDEQLSWADEVTP